MPQMVEGEDTLDAAGGPAQRLPQARTPEGSPMEGDTLSVERVRRAVHRRVFGEVVEPVRIGRYTVLGRIGAGGMGVVYAAYDTDLDRKIALKLLSSEGDEHDRVSPRRARLVREAKALARLSHPAIVQVFEVGAHEDRLFIAMEFVDGVTLGQWARSASRSWREIATMYVAAGRGLAAAHAAGLVHRDFKPDNALVGKDGRVRVLDFGLAGANDESAVELDAGQAASRVADAPLTLTGTVLGTPAYMAPEQHRGLRADPRSDQFSFCVALWEALFGERPFVGDSLAALTTAVLSGPMPVPSGTRDVPGGLRRVLLRGLEREPGSRYPAMDDLLAEIERTLGAGRRLGPMIVALGVSATVGGLGLHWITREPDQDARISGLESAVEDQRTRAEAAEQSVAQRGQTIVLAEATAMLERDPTQAIAILRTLAPDAPAWSDGTARMLAADAVARGVADHVIALPECDGPRLLSPAGRWAWSTDPLDHRYRLVELATGREMTLEAGAPKPFPHLTFSPDESRVVTAQAGAVRLWDLVAGGSRELATLSGFASARRFSSDGARVVIVESRERHEAIVIELDGATRRIALDESTSEVITPDGAALVISDSSSRLELRDLDTGERRLLGDGAMGQPVVAPGARHVAALTRDGIEVWPLPDGESFVLPIPAGLRGDALVFDPSGSSLALASAAGPVVVWELASRKHRRLARAGTGPGRVVLARGGEDVAVVDPEGTVTLYTAAGVAVRTLRTASGIVDVAMVDDRLITVGPEPRARVWSWPSLGVVAFPGGPVVDVVLQGDGVLGASGDGAIRRADARGQGVLVPPGESHAAEVELSPTGTLAIGRSDRVLLVDDAGRTTAEFAAPGGAEGLRFVDGGTALAWFDPDGVQMWRPGSDATDRWPGEWLDAAMSPDAGAIATLSRNAGTIVLTLWDASTRAERWHAAVEPGWRIVRFEAGGTTIGVAGTDDAIGLFTAEDGARRDLAVGEDRYEDLAVNLDARVVIALGSRAHVIDADSGKAYEIPVASGTSIWSGRSVATRHDGRVFAFPGADGIVWRHAFDAPADPEALRTWAAGQTDLEPDASTTAQGDQQ